MRFQRITSIVALLWAIAVGLFVLFGPIYASSSGEIAVSQSGNDVRSTITHRRASGLEVSGPGILLAVGVPVLLTLAPILIRKPAAWLVAGSLLLFLCFIAAASIGFFYIPPALLLILSGILKDRSGS